MIVLRTRRKDTADDYAPRSRKDDFAQCRTWITMSIVDNYDFYNIERLGVELFLFGI